MVRTLQCRCIYLLTRYVDHEYVPLVVALPDPFLIHDITRFVTRVTRWMPLVEQELLTLPEHLSSGSMRGVFSRYICPGPGGQEGARGFLKSSIALTTEGLF